VGRLVTRCLGGERSEHDALEGVAVGLVAHHNPRPVVGQVVRGEQHWTRPDFEMLSAEALVDSDHRARHPRRDRVAVAPVVDGGVSDDQSVDFNGRRVGRGQPEEWLGLGQFPDR
jgi:hypothetical protein